jgi:hypothetical protein
MIGKQVMSVFLIQTIVLLMIKVLMVVNFEVLFKPSARKPEITIHFGIHSIAVVIHNL